MFEGQSTLASVVFWVIFLGVTAIWLWFFISMVRNPNITRGWKVGWGIAMLGVPVLMTLIYYFTEYRKLHKYHKPYKHASD